MHYLTLHLFSGWQAWSLFAGPWCVLMHSGILLPCHLCSLCSLVTFIDRLLLFLRDKPYDGAASLYYLLVYCCCVLYIGICFDLEVPPYPVCLLLGENCERWWCGVCWCAVWWSAFVTFLLFMPMLSALFSLSTSEELRVLETIHWCVCSLWCMMCCSFWWPVSAPFSDCCWAGTTVEFILFFWCLFLPDMVPVSLGIEYIVHCCVCYLGDQSGRIIYLVLTILCFLMEVTCWEPSCLCFLFSLTFCSAFNIVSCLETCLPC
jgi:hypothetical protein